MIQLPKRRSIRLSGHDYSLPGWYYITLCTNNRRCLFGNILKKKMILNNVGKMANQHWHKLPKRFTNVSLDEYIIMPNHLHGIVVINNLVGATLVGARSIMGTHYNWADHDPNRAGIKPAPTGVTLGNIIGVFKSLITNEYIKNIKNNNWKPFNKRLFQRNFYEHIIRNQTELDKIRRYIKSNPKIWDRDRNNPDLEK